MKNKNLIVILIAVILIIAAIIGCVMFFSLNNKGNSNIFKCTTFDEIENFVDINNVPYEKHDNTLHLFNVNAFGQVGYVVADFESDTRKVQRIDFYMTFENNETLSQRIENVRNEFLKEFEFQGEYEFYPLENNSENVSEKDFLEGKASKELFVYEENTLWNVSWHITDDVVSARISKSVSN